MCVGGGGGEEGGGGQSSHLSPVCGLCVADDSAGVCVWVWVEGEGRAPIFLQFVDCVWQMTVQVCVCGCVGGGGGEEGGGG